MSDDAELNKRIAWLERKMVHMLWLLISTVSGSVGMAISIFAVDAQHPWLRIAVFVAVWLALCWFLQRDTFKGAPDHIRFLS